MSIKTIIGAVKQSGQQIALANTIQLACTLLCITSRRLTWDPESQILRLTGIRDGKAFDLKIGIHDLCHCVNRGQSAGPGGTGPPGPPP